MITKYHEAGKKWLRENKGFSEILILHIPTSSSLKTVCTDPRQNIMLRKATIRGWIGDFEFHFRKQMEYSEFIKLIPTSTKDYYTALKKLHDTK